MEDIVDTVVTVLKMLIFTIIGIVKALLPTGVLPRKNVKGKFHKEKKNIHFRSNYTNHGFRKWYRTSNGKRSELPLPSPIAATKKSI